MTVAGDRLAFLSGAGPVTAGDRLVAIGSGVSAGERLVNRSSLAVATAGQHLMSDFPAAAGAEPPLGLFMVNMGRLMLRIGSSTAAPGEVAMAMETDEAMPVSVGAAMAIGGALEADTATAMTGILAVAISQASETDAATALAGATALAVGQASELDSAVAVTGAVATALGQAAETDTAQAMSYSPYTGDILLHCVFEGADADTSWPDLSPYARTLTGGATLQLSDAQSKWGTTSLRWLNRTPTSAVVTGAEFGLTANEPFTVAMWVYRVGTRNFVAACHFFRWLMDETWDDLWNYSDAALVQYNNQNFGDEMTPAAYTSNEWTHFECGFDGTTMRVFVGGNVAASISRTNAAETSGTFTIGGVEAPSSAPDGMTDVFMGEIFVIRGQCLHTAAFTPPTTAYQ